VVFVVVTIVVAFVGRTVKAVAEVDREDVVKVKAVAEVDREDVLY
jgi:hypothetical protein